ncbi:MAG: hypothetical protein RR550_02290 [Rikenellaceae bacterium]
MKHNTTITENLFDSMKNVTLPAPPLEQDSIIRDTTKAIVKENIPQYKALYTEEQLTKMEKKERLKAEKLMSRDRKRFDRELRRMANDDKLFQILEKEKAAADSLAAANVPKVDSVAKEEEIIEIKNVPDTNDMIVRGFGHAKIFKVDMQSIADTIITETVDSTTTSIGAPIAWNGLNQITAGRIRSYVLNGEMHRTRMFTDPILGQQVEGDQYNQLKGDNMDALYRNNDIYKLIVTGNATSRFYRVEEDKETKEQDVVAFITTKAMNMIIDFDSSAIIRIKWVGDTESYTYPMDRIPEETRIIEGFKWTPELRPLKEEVFNRVIRPSVRAEKMLIPKPAFDITKEIMEQRKRLLKEGIWTDRNDKLKINREELVNQSLEQR